MRRCPEGTRRCPRAPSKTVRRTPAARTARRAPRAGSRPQADQWLLAPRATLPMSPGETPSQTRPAWCGLLRRSKVRAWRMLRIPACPALIVAVDTWCLPPSRGRRRARHGHVAAWPASPRIRDVCCLLPLCPHGVVGPLHGQKLLQGAELRFDRQVAALSRRRRCFPLQIHSDTLDLDFLHCLALDREHLRYVVAEAV